MAATKTGTLGVTTRKGPTAPSKTAQNLKTAAPKRAVTKSASALKDRATNDTNRELSTEMINNDATIKPVTRSRSKTVNQTAAVKPSTTSSIKKSSVKATKDNQAATEVGSNATTRPTTNAPPAARPVTRSMRNNDESSIINVPPEPNAQARENLTAPFRRVTRRMAKEDTLVSSPSITIAPVVDVGARDRPVNPSTTSTPRARVVRPGITVNITANQERSWAGRNRASLRRAIEGDQEWPELTHGQRREMIRLFAWVESEPGRTHHDYFNLPVRHEALTTRSNVEHSVSFFATWAEQDR